jgi:glutamyl-tRNA synthetase
MEISHVIRGDEWISSTPKHILLYQSFGWTPPIFMHMPLLLGQDGKKLSKRKNPTSIFFYRDSGFLPEAMINFLSLMGYSMKDDLEIYSIKELIKQFSPERFGKSGAFFDIKKMEWLNQKYIVDNLSEEDLLSKIKSIYLNDDFLKQLMPLAHSRIKTFGDFFDLCDFLFKNNITYTEELLCPRKINNLSSASILQLIIWCLDKENWELKTLEETSHKIASYLDLNHKKDVMPILFGSIMGKRFGPPLFSSAEILGKERVRARFLTSIEFLGGISNKKLKTLKEGWDKNNFYKI